MLKKILLMVMEEKDIFYTEVTNSPFQPVQIPDIPCFVFNHVYPGFSLYRNAAPDHYVKVLLIRDPRDAMVSFMHMLRGGWGPWTPRELLSGFNSIPSDYKLASTILFPDAYLGLGVFFREAVEWMRDPSVLVLRFEDLVGPRGGGNSVVQYIVIKAFFEHAGFHLLDEEIMEIADAAFGPEGTPKTTFREGQIGTWPQYFTEGDKALFKKLYGDVLIEFGYEQDYDW